MSEPRLISPMLDNFLMGDPISNHHGVRCCPAMEKDSDDKYIVKIVSVPASQVQLDALLLTGACKDEESALSYFKELAEIVAEEAYALQRMSQMEGFLPYHSWQIVPMENEVGYDVYLLGTYKKTLEKHFRRNSMTHLGAINLGLDLCSALAVCRRMGYLYADLKPGNIFITEDNEYRIGDLGFLSLENLKYASLPDKYRSEYTPPELADPYTTLNTTIDIYALGLILYQAYNDGILPETSATENGDPLPAPAYADYEMAEIILKACAADPQERWQDPAEMGQALVSYMQRNGANDTPIVPAPVPAVELTDVDVTMYSEPEDAEAEDAAEIHTEAIEDISADEDTAAEPSESDAVNPTEDSAEPVQEEPIKNDEYENLSFLTDAAVDETAPGHEPTDLDYDEVTEEVSEILTIADELISHETPDPVIPPEPIDVPIPPPIVEEEAPEVEEEQEAETEFEADTSDEAEEVDIEEESDSEEEAEEDGSEPEELPVPKTSRRWIILAIAALLAVSLLFVGFYYYQHYYLQPVSISLSGSEDSLIVYVESEMDDSKLTVICSDAYGNQLLAPVVNGKAVFEGLAPNSAYNVKVLIQGFHHLTGNSSTGYSTPAQTNISEFRASAGATDGSVILNVTYDGPAANQWLVTYTAEGEEEKTVPFTGYTVTLSQLTIGKEYTFILMPADDLYVTGTNTVTFTACKVITPQDLTVTGFVGGSLTVTWKSPADIPAEGWIVHCYNDSGYNETLTVQETTAAFSNIDHNSNYTVEVKAAGMSSGQRTYVTGGSITIQNLQKEITDDGRLKLTWDSSVPVSSEGWIIKYTFGDTVTKQVTAGENAVTIPALIPGETCQISIQTANGTQVYAGTLTYTAGEAEKFSGYTVTADNMTFSMCKTPDKENWDRYDLNDSDYVTTFTAGEKASFLAKMRKEYETSEDLIATLFVIRDSQGTIVSADHTEATWTSMWYRNYCELDIPSIPAVAGTYNISIYFNGASVFATDFTVTNE